MAQQRRAASVSAAIRGGSTQTRCSGESRRVSAERVGLQRRRRRRARRTFKPEQNRRRDAVLDTRPGQRHGFQPLRWLRQRQRMVAQRMQPVGPQLQL